MDAHIFSIYFFLFQGILSILSLNKKLFVVCPCFASVLSGKIPQNLRPRPETRLKGRPVERNWSDQWYQRPRLPNWSDSWVVILSGGTWLDRQGRKHTFIGIFCAIIFSRTYRLFLTVTSPYHPWLTTWYIWNKIFMWRRLDVKTTFFWKVHENSRRKPPKF